MYLLVSCWTVSVRQQEGKGVQPGLAHGSAYGDVPFSWLLPHTMVDSKSAFTCSLMHEQA